MAVKAHRSALAAHTAGIFADMTLDGPEIGTLVAVIDRAKNLPNRKTMGKQNPYCAMRLGKEARKTDTDKRGGQTPKWDQEIRFTVHESPDYYRLKCSVFNDDKKTDLIGEAWIDLSDLIKPGGGSNDLWHHLNYKGKYAGDIRIELTYYDLRPREEKATEKKKIREKAPTPSLAPAADAPTTVSGPRQLGPRDVRRRPLPVSPGSTPPIQTPAQTPPTQTPPAVSTPQEELAVSAPPRIPQDQAVSQPVMLPQPMQLPPQSQPQPQPQSQSQPQSQVASQMQARPYHEQDQFDSYENDYLPVQAPTHHYRQPYIEEQPSTSDSTYYGGDESRDIHEQQLQLSYNNEQALVRQGSSLPSHPSWSDEAEMQDQSYRRRSQHAPVPDIEYYDSPHTLPSPQVQSQEAIQHRSPRSSMSPIKAISYRDSPLRQSMNQHDVAPAMVDEPESYDAPPPPPRHRETTPRRHQPEYPPSSFPQDNPPPHHNPLPVRATPRRTSINERSPLQAMEHEYDSYSKTCPPSNPPAQRQSWCEPYYERRDSQRQSSSGRPEHYTPERRSSYDPYQVQDFDQASTDHYARQNYEGPSQGHAVRRPHRDRSGSYEDRRSTFETVETDEPYGLVPYSSSQPNLPLASYLRPQPIRPQPVTSNTNQTPPRKAVSSGPYPEPPGRRLSDNPFSPDAYDVLNPASSPVTNEGTIYQTHEQAKEAARCRKSEKFYDEAPIIGNDGRVIDPSDHLPSDTWAPEPERKQRKPEHVIHVRTRTDIRSSASSNSSPVPVRTQYHSRQRQSQSTPVSSPAAAPPSSGRNRLSKQAPTRPLPQEPYQRSMPEPSPPAESVNQQALQRYSYQDHSSQVHRPQLSEYQVPVSNSYSPRGSAYHHGYDLSAPETNVHAGRDYDASHANGYHDSLAAEMSMIDIGPSRGGRMLVKSSQRY